MMACYGTAAIVLGVGRPTGRRVPVWASAALVATLVGFSRVYLGVHWWTDVVGGLALGGLWLCLLEAVILLRFAHGPRPEPVLIGSRRG